MKESLVKDSLTARESKVMAKVMFMMDLLSTQKDMVLEKYH